MKNEAEAVDRGAADDLEDETATALPDRHALRVVGLSHIGAAPLSPLDQVDLSTGQGIDESAPTT